MKRYGEIVRISGPRPSSDAAAMSAKGALAARMPRRCSRDLVPPPDPGARRRADAALRRPASSPRRLGAGVRDAAAARAGARARLIARSPRPITTCPRTAATTRRSAIRKSGAMAQALTTTPPTAGIHFLRPRRSAAGHRPRRRSRAGPDAARARSSCAATATRRRTARSARSRSASARRR